MPLSRDADGVIRVGGTRVTLESVIHEYQRGSNPDQIATEFPVLDLASIYHVVGYYLAHRAEVDAYLAQQASESAVQRQLWEAEHPPLIRSELQKRLEQAHPNSEEE